VHLAGRLHSSALGRAIDLSKARAIERAGSGDSK